jgi:hypothetical protein
VLARRRTQDRLNLPPSRHTRIGGRARRPARGQCDPDRAANSTERGNVTAADRRGPERARDQRTARRAVARDLGSQRDGACLASEGGASLPATTGSVRPPRRCRGRTPFLEVGPGRTPSCEVVVLHAACPQRLGTFSAPTDAPILADEELSRHAYLLGSSWIH